MLVALRQLLVRFHVVLPGFPLLDVVDAEFPVLLRLIDAAEEALALFFLGKMQEELDDPGAIAVKVVLQVHDGTIPVAPDGLLAEQFFWESLGIQNFLVHANDQHLLVVRAIEDADAAPFGQLPRRVPQEVVVQFLGDSGV